MITIQTLASGSKGNSVYIATEDTKILLDVGLSLPRLLKRMESANIDPATITAVVITHEHSDHVLGLESFVRRFKPMVYLHSAVVDLFPTVPAELIQTFEHDFVIGDIDVSFFVVPHDSAFCFGYSFQCGNAKFSYATDLGRVSDATLQKMRGSQIVMIECNHDILRLTSNTKYPLILKKRIMSSHGHLSNNASAMAVYNLSQLGCTQVILAHLSEQNNSPTLAYECVKNFLNDRGVTAGKDIWIDVAAQDKPSLPFQIDTNA